MSERFYTTIGSFDKEVSKDETKCFHYSLVPIKMADDYPYNIEYNIECKDCGSKFTSRQATAHIDYLKASQR